MRGTYKTMAHAKEMVVKEVAVNNAAVKEGCKGCSCLRGGCEGYEGERGGVHPKEIVLENMVFKKIIEKGIVVR